SRMLIIFLVLLVVSGVFCGSAAAVVRGIDTAQNLSNALNLTTESGDGAAYVNGEGKVVLLQDVWLNHTITITARDPITLTANESNDFTIYRHFDDGFLFRVSSGTFIMEGSNGHNLTIDGNRTTYSSNGSSLVYVDGGEFTMNAGSVLQNSNTPHSGGGVYVVYDGTFNMIGGTISNNNATTYYGGGVYVDGGTFNMTGGTISNNTASYGGGVYVDGGTVTMNDGTIISNNTAYDGGGVYVTNTGILTMNGGTISGNTADNWGGGVFVVYCGTFNMNNGTISNNTADYGSGVLVMPDSTFNMDGGSISGNTAMNGGGVYVVSSGTFNLAGGTISNNTASYGGGVSVHGSTFTMTGGTISNNTATYGGGVYVDYGTFNMNGSAIVNSDNDVYLDHSLFITVMGNLASDAGSLNITPAFTSGTVIRYNDGVSPETWTDNFALNQTWAINHPTLALAQSGNEIILGTNCTVNFSIDETTIYLSQYNVSGTLLAQPADPTRSGYTFNGWNTTNASGTSWNFSTTRIAGNTSLYANWTVNPTPTPTPTSSENGGNGGNDDNNADYGPVSADGAFTTNDGSLTIHYPAGSSIIVTVFKDYFNGASAPSGVSYLRVYDVHSTADSGTSASLVFRVNKSVLEEKGLTPEDISILHHYNGEWYRMTITSIDLIDGVYQFTVTSDRLSLFMVAYNVGGVWFPLEGEATSTPTTGPTVIEPTPTTTQTKAASSPVPVLGIIAGLLGMALLSRRE
ncbi:MAG: InlB B-repeat-containing protein, partial [Methanocorpusculum sp.]|nr:InlB B-repeat-containing protein [Methanocorpusculum sp.]